MAAQIEMLLRKHFTRQQILSLEIFLHRAGPVLSGPGPRGFSLTSLMDDPAMYLAYIRMSKATPELQELDWISAVPIHTETTSRVYPLCTAGTFPVQF